MIIVECIVEFFSDQVEINEKFTDNVTEFINYAMTVEDFIISIFKRCPCERC